MADAGDVYVDAAVKFSQFAVECLDRQGLFADDLSSMAHQNFEQVEFGAGQLERSVFDAGLAFGRVQNDVADRNAVRRVVLFVAVLRTAQDGVDAGQEFARCAWFPHPFPDR